MKLSKADRYLWSYLTYLKGMYMAERFLHWNCCTRTNLTVWQYQSQFGIKKCQNSITLSP